MSTTQRQRGAATRARIIDAATRLFCRDGYLATTVVAIADQAGVAVQTLYLSFGSKVAILSAAHDVAVVGDAEPVPMLDRDWVRRLTHASDVETALADALANLRESTERVAGIYAVIQAAAADPLVAELLTQLRRRRIETCRVLAELLLAVPGADAHTRPERLADVLYALLGVESYELFVTERGWPGEGWQRWTYEAISPDLFARPPANAAPRRDSVT